MKTPVRIGLLDSGVSPDLAPRMAAARAFALSESGEVEEGAPLPDPIGHGSNIARILIAAAPTAAIVNAQAFRVAHVTAPAAIAAALHWLVEERAQLINMSFGLRQNRPILREACQAALEAGVILVASAPARGPAVYPAAYSGVLRVTGDARCGLTEFSHLATDQADFGACPRSYDRPQPGAAVGGASFAVPHVVAALANFLVNGGDASSVRQYLHGIAHYHGPERRRG
ncbi:MAG: S8 family serine peptidase [Gammaproteobacteria bacterium]